MDESGRLYIDFIIAVEDYTSFLLDAAKRGDFNEMLRDVDSLRREIVRMASAR